MQDVSGGVERVRKWPKARGPAKTPKGRRENLKFAVAQQATKYFPPQMYLDYFNGSQDSPLLPRDLMTMQLYNRLFSFHLDNGFHLMPVQAGLEVSQSLDAISQREGEILIRTKEGWRGRPLDLPRPAAFASPVIDLAGKTECTLTGLSEFAQATIFVHSARTNAQGIPLIRWRASGGTSGPQLTTGYYFPSANGDMLNGSALFPITNNSTGPSMWAVQLNLNPVGDRHHAYVQPSNRFYMGPATADKLDSITISSTGGAFTAGSLQILAH